MCGDCWNAAMGAPAAAVAARFAWIGYKDRIPFVGRRSRTEARPVEPDIEPETATRCQAPRGDAVSELVDSGAPPP